ncbi:MAG: hypothetical protein K2X39_00185, partial [Silvanigrellaceae bacterium]|nr:hypothetical protein [Silvanigrellaceae bacterium]
IQADLVNDEDYEVLAINSVEMTDLKTNETKQVPYFNETEDSFIGSEKVMDIIKVWSVSRSLYTKSKQEKLSRLFLTIRDRFEYLKKTEIQKENIYHLFINGKCSNGIHAEKIKSLSSFDYTGTLPIKSVYSLLTTSRRVQNRKILSNANYVSELLAINNKISCNYINDLNIIKVACQIISMNSEDIFVFIERLFSQCESISKQESFKSIYRNGIHYQIPCYEFNILFHKGARPSIGAYFLNKFFEKYFNYIHAFNYDLKINILNRQE